MTHCRLISLNDAPVLAGLLQVNRDFLAPFEPVRGDDYFTETGQRAAITAALAEYAQGRSLPFVIETEDAGPVGRITLNGIVRGPFLSCSVGYWVSQAAGGRGVATAALRQQIAGQRTEGHAPHPVTASDKQPGRASRTDKGEPVGRERPRAHPVVAPGAPVDIL